MIKYINTTTPILSEVSITCDICGNEYDMQADIDEYQEFTRIRNYAGYGSIFGDNNDVECDICQNCLKSKLGEFLRIKYRSDSGWF